MLLNSVDLWSVKAAVLGLVASLFVYAIYSVFYNLFLHPLRKYPGPLGARATLLATIGPALNGSVYFWLDRQHKKYGPVVRMGPNTLSFTDPACWNDIYNAKPQLPKSPFSFPPPRKGTNEGILMANDEKHAQLRKAIAPAFTGRSMEEIEPVLQEKSSLMVQQMREEGKRGAKPLSMQDWAQYVVSDIIGVLAMGVQFNCLQEKRHHPWPNSLNQNLKKVMFANILRRLGLNSVLTWLFNTPAAKRAADAVIGQSNIYVKERLEREKTAEGKKEKDIIGSMIRDEQNEKEPMDEEDVMSMAITLVAAGSETTSAALTGLMYYLVNSPQSLRKLTAEVRSAFATEKEITIKGIAKLPYLNATIEEGLRLFIPAPSLPPRVTQAGGHTVNGEWIPPGVNIVMANYSCSHSDRNFDNAHAFRPERWLPAEAGGTGGAHVKNAYQPFSLGPRNCVGKLLAVTELRLIVSKLVWGFDIELAEEVPDFLETAQFFIAWELKKLMIRFTPRS